MNLNRVTIAGNLVRDPEIRYTQAGKGVCNFTVAVNRRWRGEDKIEHEDTAFIDCTAFGSACDLISQNFRKGVPIYLEGRLKTDSWEDKATGQKRSKLGVIVESFQYVTPKRDAVPPGDAPRAPKPATAPKVQPEHDDVPF